MRSPCEAPCFLKKFRNIASHSLCVDLKDAILISLSEVIKPQAQQILYCTYKYNVVHSVPKRKQHSQTLRALRLTGNIPIENRVYFPRLLAPGGA